MKQRQHKTRQPSGFYHVTLDTGHSRWSPRSEVRQLEALLSKLHDPVLGKQHFSALGTGHELLVSYSAERNAWAFTIFSDGSDDWGELAGKVEPLVTCDLVSPRCRCRNEAWKFSVEQHLYRQQVEQDLIGKDARALHYFFPSLLLRAQEVPSMPTGLWLSVSFHSGLFWVPRQQAEVLGDMERCIAWALMAFEDEFETGTWGFRSCG